MTYFDNYKKRMLASGSSTKEAYENSTIEIIKRNFKNSPNYKQITINGSLIDSRVINTDNYNQKEVLLLPNSFYDIGTVYEFDSKKWIVLNFDDNDLFPKSEVDLCNSTLKWKDSSGTVYDYPCIFFNPSITYDKLKTDDYMTLQTGQIGILVSENLDTSTVKVDMRFIYKHEAWKVEYIDKTKDGILSIVVSSDVVKDSDDLVNRIADNSKPNSTNNTTPSNGNLW